MTTLIVNCMRSIVSTADDNVMHLHRTLIREETGVNLFEDCTHFGDIKNVDIVLMKQGQFVQFEIGDALRKSVIKFLNSYHGKQDSSFDCYSFASLVGGITKPHDKKHLAEYWDLSVPLGHSRSGDIVFLIDKNKGHFYHAAIYAGFGLYISVYGAGGNLEFSKLKDMRKDFKSEHVIRATPKK